MRQTMCNTFLRNSGVTPNINFQITIHNFLTSSIQMLSLSNLDNYKQSILPCYFLSHSVYYLSSPVPVPFTRDCLQRYQQLQSAAFTPIISRPLISQHKAVLNYIYTCSNEWKIRQVLLRSVWNDYNWKLEAQFQTLFQLYSYHLRLFAFSSVNLFLQ